MGIWSPSSMAVVTWSLTRRGRARIAEGCYHGSLDFLAVQVLLGHSKPETTRMYVKLPDDRSPRSHEVGGVSRKVLWG